MKKCVRRHIPRGIQVVLSPVIRVLGIVNLCAEGHYKMQEYLLAEDVLLC